MFYVGDQKVRVFDDQYQVDLIEDNMSYMNVH